VIRNFPLVFIHPTLRWQHWLPKQRLQGKYWEMYNTLFTNRAIGLACPRGFLTWLINEAEHWVDKERVRGGSDKRGDCQTWCF
jgi:hypothetical protein